MGKGKFELLRPISAWIVVVGLLFFGCASVFANTVTFLGPLEQEVSVTASIEKWIDVSFVTNEPVRIKLQSCSNETSWLSFERSDFDVSPGSTVSARLKILVRPSGK